jgi:hypothetical protein
MLIAARMAFQGSSAMSIVMPLLPLLQMACNCLPIPDGCHSLASSSTSLRAFIHACTSFRCLGPLCPCGASLLFQGRLFVPSYLPSAQRQFFQFILSTSLNKFIFFLEFPLLSSLVLSASPLHSEVLSLLWLVPLNIPTAGFPGASRLYTRIARLSILCILVNTTTKGICSWGVGLGNKALQSCFIHRHGVIKPCLPALYSFGSVTVG